uniref:MIR domain-containing protein n=1 Tax=Amphimedon queenslandica TaxID=400682 RepID=A0A1X7UK67_AMPQE
MAGFVGSEIPLYEGDIIKLFCHCKIEGFINALTPSSKYSCVTVLPLQPASNVHFASFQVLAEKYDVITSPLEVSEVSQLSRDFPCCSLVYGRKVKLLHVASKMYFSVDLSSNSTIKNVKLVEDFEEKTCVFRILPSETNKHAGEDVLSLDKIKLKSVSDKMHYVFSAFNPLMSRYELKVAATHSIFEISLQSRNNMTLPHKAGCDVVMLFNHKCESYLAGREFYDEIKENTVTEVGARQKKLVHGIQKAPSLSFNCYWQLEKAETPHNSDHFEYGDHCRIKHLLTGQYLSVALTQQEKVHVSLKKLEAAMIEDETQFCLLPVLGKEGCITKGSCVEIKHNKLGKKISIPTIIYECGPSSMGNTEWLKVGLEDNHQYFCVEEVNPDFIHECYHMSGVIAVLKNYLQKFKDDSTPPSFDEPLDVLNRLLEWLNVEGRAVARANMLRMSQGVDLLLCFYDVPHKDLKRKISVVLQAFLDPAVKKNHRYLANDRFLDILFKQINHKIGVEEVLSSLVEIESTVTAKVVNKFAKNTSVFNQINKNMDTSILDFLSTLCVTAGKPNQVLQNAIFEKIITKDHFIHTEVIEKDSAITNIRFTGPPEIAGCLMSDICSKEKYSIHMENCVFFIAQLKLLSRICKGANIKCIRHIQKLVTFEEALFLINNYNLHPLLRSAYLGFVVSVYVDPNVEESKADVDNMWHIFHWNMVSENSLKTACIADRHDLVSDGSKVLKVQSSIESFLKNFKYENYLMEGNIEVLSQVLSVLEPLILNGFYWNNPTDVAKFLTDIISKESNNQKVLCAKRKAVHSLHLLFKMLSYIALARFLYDFKLLRKDLHVEEIIESRYSYLPVNESLAALLSQQVPDYQLNEQTITQACSRLKYVFQNDGYVCFDVATEDGKNLVETLIDLMKYDIYDLRLSSALLLFDIFQKENILFRNAETSCLITTDCSKEFSKLMIQYGCFSDDKHPDDSCSSDIDDTCSSDIDDTCSLNNHDKKPKKVLLKLLQGQAIEGPVHEKVASFLNDTKIKCMIDGDETQPHSYYQKIVFSAVAFSAIFEYIQLFYSTDSNEQVPLMKLSCNCLQAIARRNHQVQSKLFLKFIDFVDARIAIAPLARLMTETLSGNHLLCLQLSEGTITHLYMVAATSSNVEHCEFFTTLETIIKPYKWSKLDNGVPLLMKNYQTLIAKVVLKHIQEQFYPLLLKSTQEERLTALKDTCDYKCLQLLAVSDLLASVAEGPCQHAEDICQDIFSLDDLVNVMSNPDIKFHNKKPFARIMNEGYINTERESLLSIAELSKISAFWGHLEECAQLVKMMHNNLSQNHVELNHVKIKVRILFSQHSSFAELEERNKKEFDDVMEYNGKFILVSSLLSYLIEGLIPLVTSICSQLCIDYSSELPDQPSSSLLTAPNVTVLKKFTDSLLILIQQHPEAFFTMPEMTPYWTKFIDSVVNMMPIDQQGWQEQLNAVRETVLANEDFYISTDLKNVGKDLADEISLNDDFQTFIHNFKAAYECNAKTDQENFHHEDFTRTSFQELVLFSGYDFNIKAEKLLDFINVSYKQLQKPLTSDERSNIDFAVLASLHILCDLVPRIDSDLLILELVKKVIAFLAHPKDKIAIQVFEFFRLLLYNCSETAQHYICITIMQEETKFFDRLYKLLTNFIASIGSRPIESVRETDHKTAIFMQGMSDEEEETDFCGHQQRNVQLHTIERARQPETSESGAIKGAGIVLDVVSYLCDGQNFEMQNLLRKQEEAAFFSVNIVGLVAELFEKLAKNFSENTISSLKTAIQALIEVCAGNFGNQEVAFKGQVIDSINIILLMKMDDPQKENELIKVKASALELLEVIVEETSWESKNLAQRIAQDLSMKGLVSTITEFWDIYNKTKKRKDKSLAKIAERAMFRGYHVYKRIWGQLSEVSEEMQHHLGKTKCIEVNYETKFNDKILMKVHFPFYQEELTKTEKKIVQDNIKRDSPEAKVKDLLNWMESMKRNLKHREKLKQKWYLHLAVAVPRIRNFLLIVLTLLLNLFVVLLLEIPDKRSNTTADYMIADPVGASWFSDILIYILGSFHIILSIWMVIEYFVNEYPNILFLSYFVGLLLDFFKWIFYSIEKKGSENSQQIDFSEFESFFKQHFQVYFFNFRPLYCIVFLVCSIVAMGYEGYFYCGCILYAFLNNNVLQQVLIAISKSAAQLISVALLALGILLVFAVISFVFLHDFFDNENLFCRTLFECYISVTREGLLDTIGTILPVKYMGQTEPSFKIYAVKSIFDLAFFIIITTLGLNIVIAILVDRFSELRSEREKVNQDKQTYCFICGIDSDTFERKGKGFENHVIHDHHMWNYVYYMLYLDSMDAKDHNAIEKYVYECIKDKDIGFFPLRQAEVLGGRVDDAAIQKS